MEKQIYSQFHNIEKRHWWFNGMYAACYDMIKRIAKNNGGISILDIGCGTGAWTQQLAQIGDVYAIDSSDEALKICKSRRIDNLICANADSLALIGGKFDLASGLGLIEHVDNDAKFLSELARALRPGGHAIILTSAYNFLWGEHDDLVHHKRRYTMRNLNRLILGSGLEIEKATYMNTFLFIPILLMRFLERVLPKKGNHSGESADLRLPPKLLNSFFYGLLRLESLLLRSVNLPFGVSILVVARKP